MKILVIGCGSIGKVHARSVIALGHELAVMDQNRERAESLAVETQAGACFYDEKSAYDWKPEVVIIATPNHLHLAGAKKALENGCHVLIEKPVSNSLEGLENFARQASSGNLHVNVVSNMRFHPAIEVMRDNLNKIGKVYYVRSYYGNYLPNMRPQDDYRKLYCARRETGGGVILDAIHEIDYLLWLFGDVDGVNSDRAKLSDLDIDVEDFANLVLSHRSGVKSVITMDYLRQYKRRGCEIIGSEGMIIWESEGKQPEACKVRLFESKDRKWTMLYETDNLDNTPPYVNMMRNFLDSIHGGAARLQTVDDAKTRLAVTLEALG